MGFPWRELIDGMGLPILVILIMLAPAIVGALLGEIIRFFRHLFGRDDAE